MKTPKKFPLLLPLFILLFAAIASPAQVDDIRISPPDPLTYSLPDSAAMQSAATIGDRTLVVWGSMALDDYGMRVATLMMQMVVGGVPVGSPVRINEPSSPPTSMVAVLALKDRFLVIWRDARNPSGMFSSRGVALDGTLSGQVDAIKAPVPIAETQIWVRAEGDGYTLSWMHSPLSPSSYDRSYFSRQRLDAEGRVIGKPEPLLKPYNYASIMYPEGPGLVFEDQGEFFTVFHSDRGVYDERQIDGTRLRAASFLNADTSLLSIHAIGNKRPALQYYRNVFDEMPERSISLSEGPGSIPLDQFGSVRKLSGGRYEITYALASTNWGYTPQDTVVRIRRRILDANGMIGDPVTLKVITNTSYQGCDVSRINDLRSVGGGYHMFSDDGIERSSISISGALTYPTTLTCRIDVVFTPDGGVFWTDELQGIAGAGDIRNRADIGRLVHDSLSQVSLHLNGNQIVLSALSVGSAGMPHQCHPSLARQGGTFQVGWQQLGSAERVMFGETALMPDLAFRPIDSIVWDRPLEFPDLYGSANASYGYIVPVEHAVLIDRRSAFLSGGTKSTSSYTDRYQSLCYGSPAGLKSTAGLKHSASLSYSYWYSIHDPNTRGTVVSQYNMWGSGNWFLEVYALDSNGNKVWQDSISTGYRSRFVPVAPNEFYAYDINTCAPLVRYKNGAAIGQADISPLTTMQLGRFRRLLGDRFLRIHAAQPVTGLSANDLYLHSDKPSSNTLAVVADSLVVVELYDIDGGLLAATTIKAPTRYYDFSVMQVRRDSSILIVWGSDNGIRLTVLGSNLQMRERDILISHTEKKAVEPAIVLEDTVLHLVWADYRNPGADIYGTSWSLPAWLRSIPGREGGNRIAVGRALPTPSHDRAAIPFTAPAAGPLSVALVDPLGRRVRLETREDIPAGDGTLELDLRGVAPGIYTVVLTGSDGAHGSARIVVTK